MTGITTDFVCIQLVLDTGVWKTNRENYEAAIKQIKMQGGVFGWVTDSNKFVKTALIIEADDSFGAVNYGSVF